MNTLKLAKPHERYIFSYWETFDTIAKEKKYLAFNEGFPYDKTVEFIKNSIKNGYPHLFIIDVEKDICVGWCDITPISDIIGYLGMGLLREYRGRGVGKMALQEVIRLSKEFGYKSIKLDVLKSNSRAIHVYEKMGFIQNNLVVNGFAWHDTLVREDVIQMSLDLI